MSRKPSLLQRLLRRPAPATQEGMDGGAIIMAVDYQRRGSNFDIGGKRFAIDRTVLEIEGVAIPYERLRGLSINRSHVSGLLGRFSLPGMVLIALGLMPAKRMQSIMSAKIVTDDGKAHVVSSMSARGFGKMPVNQLDAFRWFMACLVNRLPPGCQIRVGSTSGYAGGIALLTAAVPLAALGIWLLSEQMWWLGWSLTATAAGCAWVGVLMLRNGRARVVDAPGLLAYVGSD